MTAYLILFKDLDTNFLSKVRVGNGEYLKVEGKDVIEVETMSGTKTLKNKTLLMKKHKSESHAKLLINITGA